MLSTFTKAFHLELVDTMQKTLLRLHCQFKKKNLGLISIQYTLVQYTVRTVGTSGGEKYQIKLFSHFFLFCKLFAVRYATA